MGSRRKILEFRPAHPDAEVTEVEIDLHAADAMGGPTQGHMYRVDMYGTLEDILQLAAALLRYEAPDASVLECAAMRSGGQLMEVSDGE